MCIYSPMEIAYGVEKTRMPLRDYLLMLKEAGLNSIPGTAAEILDDRVRKSLSPNKLKVKQWIEIVRTAHSVGIPSTSTMMYGHTEEPEHWVGHACCFCATFKKRPADLRNSCRWGSSIRKRGFSSMAARIPDIRCMRI